MQISSLSITRIYSYMIITAIILEKLWVLHFHPLAKFLEFKLQTKINLLLSSLYGLYTYIDNDENKAESNWPAYPASTLSQTLSVCWHIASQSFSLGYHYMHQSNKTTWWAAEYGTENSQYIPTVWILWVCLQRIQANIILVRLGLVLSGNFSANTHFTHWVLNYTQYYNQL